MEGMPSLEVQVTAVHDVDPPASGSRLFGVGQRGSLDLLPKPPVVELRRLRQKTVFDVAQTSR